MMRAYVAIFCCTSALVIGAIGAFNYAIDPYLMHQWDTPRLQRLRPAHERLSAWGKTYALARYRPSVVYLGNSRTELGLPADLPAFERKAVFNAALSGASLGDAIAMARHAMQVSRLDTVVWGLDAPSFSLAIGTTDFDRELVAGRPLYFARRGLLDLKRALTVDTTRDALKVLMGDYGAVCRSSLALRGQRDDGCVAAHIGSWQASSAAATPRLREFMRGEGPTADAMTALESSASALCRAGVRVRLYINPTHASMQDALHWLGKWPTVENWQRQLAALAARRRDAGCDLRLYDFSGFNAITTEPLPHADNPRAMTHYWETSHYRANVGRMIGERMFGGGEVPEARDFGVELTPPVMDAYQARQREARAAYRAARAYEAALARTLAESEARSTAQPFSQ